MDGPADVPHGYLGFDDPRLEDNGDGYPRGYRQMIEQFGESHVFWPWPTDPHHPNMGYNTDMNVMWEATRRYHLEHPELKPEEVTFAFMDCGKEPGSGGMKAYLDSAKQDFAEQFPITHALSESVLSGALSSLDEAIDALEDKIVLHNEADHDLGL